MHVVERWVEQARYDLDTARAMLNSSRYLYVLFCCQQAVEKTIKAIIAKQSNEFPPRIHALIRLAEVAALELTEERAQLLRELSNYYIQTRYPEEIPAMSGKISESQTSQILEQTEEMMKWLLSMI
jgi:HEPN domain-containing protein